MDLACGFGFCTRRLKQRGAAEVLGIDVSPEMVRLAHELEEAQPLGLTCQVGDAVSLAPLEPFDLVTAGHLLTYATSKDHLLRMFRNVHNNLAAGGRVIVSTNNPAFTRSKPNCTKYGLSVLPLEPEEDRYACEAEFAASPPFRVRWYQGTKPRMSGRSRRPDSGISSGAARRWRRKTWPAMARRIGAISMTIARFLGLVCQK